MTVTQANKYVTGGSMRFTDKVTQHTFPLDFTPEDVNDKVVRRLDKIFGKLMGNVGGIGNVVFAPPVTKGLFEARGKYYSPSFDKYGRVTGVEVAFFVKDISLVSNEYKNQVEVLEVK